MFPIKAALFMCFAAPILVLLIDNVHQSQAILNCFNPNMFKTNKQPLVGERANWYPQQQQQYNYNYNYPGGYNQANPMRMFFQPKWKSGSLFGPKMGWNSWKSNQNYYRPNYVQPAALSTPNGYQFNENLNVAPFSLPSPVRPYSTVAPFTAPITLNDGWSAIPSLNSNYQQQQQQQQQIQQTPITSYDSGSYAASTKPPTKQPLIDPYAIKGALLSPTKPLTTKNNILLADGGYNVHDSYLMGLYKNHSAVGYTYPNDNYLSQQQQQVYSGYSSPAKVAQLLRTNLKRQRLEQQLLAINNNKTKSATLIQTGSQSFTMLDEPRFVGFGTVDEFNDKEARLSCSFNEAIEQTNPPVWVKFQGPYNASQVVNGKSSPAFNCVDSQCRTKQIETSNDVRFKFDNGPATSTLIIKDPRLSDYGIYRCSSLTKTLNNNPLETIYQVIRFGGL